MVKHILPNFLQDYQVYAQAERYWIDLWDQIEPFTRTHRGWLQPWFQPLPPALSEGNPIFSAVSPELRRGIRILQSEPTEQGVEFFAYSDTFGGTILDPDTIHELVISCALSDVAAFFTLSLMRPWVAGRPISLDRHENSMFALDLSPSVRAFDDRPYTSAA